MLNDSAYLVRSPWQAALVTSFHMHESTLPHWDLTSANWRICPTLLGPVSGLATGICARIAAALHAALAAGGGEHMPGPAESERASTTCEPGSAGRGRGLLSGPDPAPSYDQRRCCCTYSPGAASELAASELNDHEVSSGELVRSEGG